MEAVIQVENLQLVKGRRLIVDVPAMAVYPSEVVSLIGPNGAGKSSLFQVLACLERPTSGRVMFRGRPAGLGGDSIDVRRKMAVVFQEPLLLSGSVFENVALGLKLRRVPTREIGIKVQAWLERFEINHLARQNVRSLSGGEAQRVSLARAFVLEPEVLFLDEPFTSLDAPARVTLADRLAEVIRSTRVTALFITHHAAEIPAYTSRVLTMEKGRITADGSLHSLYNSPTTPFIRAFFQGFHLPQV